MNRLTLALTSLLLAAGAHASDTRPGTPTPQPFAQPQPPSLPSPAPGSPPLLDQGRDTHSGSTLRPLIQPKPDSDLPLLEQQRERNYQPLERQQGQP